MPAKTLSCLVSLGWLLFLNTARSEDYAYITNNGTITITKYIGGGGVVDVPGRINGLPVTCIGKAAFASCVLLTSVTIPDSVTSLGAGAFLECGGLTNVVVPNRVTSIGDATFQRCGSLVHIRVPDSVTAIGEAAFAECAALTDIIIGKNVTNIAHWAFVVCGSLKGVYFSGNPPMAGVFLFAESDQAIVYYLPGTAGWGTSFGERPTAPWFLPNPLILEHGPGFGVQPGGFGFTVSWATNADVVVEACAGLANPDWLPVATNTLVDGSSYFRDPLWGQHSQRLYRVRER